MSRSGYLALTLDVKGVVAYAQHFRDPDLLKATFPALTDEQAFAISEGRATLTQRGGQLLYEPCPVH